MSPDRHHQHDDRTPGGSGMITQNTDTTTTRRQVAAAAHWVAGACAVAVGLALLISGIAVLTTTSRDASLTLLALVSISGGLVVLSVIAADQIRRRGVLATIAASCRVLIGAGALLALLGIWAAAPTPVPLWRQDVMLWQALSVLTLALGLSELPGLLDLPGTRSGWKRELIGLQLLLPWIPTAWLLIFYPYAPVWAGSRHGLHQMLPLLLCLLIVAGVAGAQILTARHWRALARTEQWVPMLAVTR